MEALPTTSDDSLVWQAAPWAPQASLGSCNANTVHASVLDRGSRHHCPVTAMRSSRAARDPDARRRSERVRAAERRIGTVTRLLDDLVEVPGTGRRIGLDPIVGLVPVLGDVSSALVSGWIVFEAARFRLPRVVLARMLLNALVDLAFGLVPVLGDLVDFGFKANTRNLELFRRHALDPGADTSEHAAFLVGLVLLVAGVAWIAAVAIGRLLAIEIPVP